MCERNMFVCVAHTYEYMGERVTVYFNEEEEELQRFVEKYSEVAGGDSNLLKMGLRHLKNEKLEALEQLKATEDFDEIT